MNPLTNVRNIENLNENDIKNGIFDHNLTWHSQYKHSAYIFVGGLPYDLTEGDVICVFSQYGEIVNINLVRDKATGKQKGFGFICYEDQRSTILAVDNLNGIKLGGRTIRVDHVSEYRTPKSDEKDETGQYKDKVETGCRPQTPSPEPSDHNLEKSKAEKKKKKKEKKEKKKKKKKKKEIESQSDTTDNEEKSLPLSDKIIRKDDRCTSDEDKINIAKHSDILKGLHPNKSSYKYNSKTGSEQNDKRKQHESQWDKIELPNKRRDISPSRKHSHGMSTEQDKYSSKKRRSP